MKRTVMNLFLLLLLPIGLSACNLSTDRQAEHPAGTVSSPDSPEKESRAVEGITGVRLATVGELKIKIGKEEKLVIEADRDILEKIRTEMNDGILVISMKSGFSFNFSPRVRYYLTVKHLDYLATSSSGDILAPDLKGDEIEISTSSSGDIKTGSVTASTLDVGLSSSGDVRIVSVKAKRLNASLSSSGDLHIREGQVSKQNVGLSSSGDYKASNLESEEAIIRVSSSGDAHVFVTGRVRATTSSSGDIHTRGDANVEVKESSSGDVIRE